MSPTSDPLSFDPQLPDLPLVVHCDAVARRLERDWPVHGAIGAPVKVVSCRRKDTKYQPGARCVTTYELLVQQPGAAPVRTIGVVEITPAGAAHRLFHEDPRLPWLLTASDPGATRRRFAELLTSPAIEACAITPVRYKPGARCVFRYELSGPGVRRIFFGKLLAEGGEQLAATIGALYEASGVAPEMPRIPEPLAYWPDIRMLVQPEVAGGAELKDLVLDPAQESALRERWLRDAGARLAGLHAAGVDGPPRTLDNDLDELRTYVAPMAAPNPALARQYEAAVEHIAAWARAAAEETPVASHGAFRADQFMIEGDRLVMIDLDGFCQAEPARDIGNFLAYLRWKAIRRPHNIALIERAGRVFLNGYLAARPALAERRLAIYQASSLLKIAGRWFRSLKVEEWPLVPRLLEAAVQEAPRGF